MFFFSEYPIFQTKDPRFCTPSNNFDHLTYLKEGPWNNEDAGASFDSSSGSMGTIRVEIDLNGNLGTSTITGQLGPPGNQIPVVGSQQVLSDGISQENALSLIKSTFGPEQERIDRWKNTVRHANIVLGLEIGGGVAISLAEGLVYASAVATAELLVPILSAILLSITLIDGLVHLINFMLPNPPIIQSIINNFPA